jgi:hypothetical protein
VRVDADGHRDVVDFVVGEQAVASVSQEFSTLPRSGRMAWNSLSRPILAEPPAESPSTRNSSVRSVADSQSVSLPGSTATPEDFFFSTFCAERRRAAPA